MKWREERNRSMEKLEFPFIYRKGQKEMVAGIYHAISRKEQIFIQAPTGVGKTMSAFFRRSVQLEREKRKHFFI